MSHRYTCLIGNGLTVAFEPQMATSRLTATLAGEFDAAGAAGRALRSLSAATPASSLTFEDLLSPVDRLARAAPAVADLADVLTTAGRRERSAASIVARVCRQVHDVGLGIVLGTVAELTHRERGNFQDVTLPVCRALADLGAAGRPVTVATLNYDALLNAGFIEVQHEGPLLGSGAWAIRTRRSSPAWILNDLAAGYAPTAPIQPITGGPDIEARPLRARLGDFMPDARVVLLDLHGSLMWLADPTTGEIVKVETLDALRSIGYWEALREARSAWRPVVVLTDQKTEQVADYPFRLAYGEFQDALRRSDRWLIGGYGWGDEPVAEALQSAFQWRQAKGRGTRVLVVCTSSPGRARARAVEVIGCPPTAVRASSLGFPPVMRGKFWRRWWTS